MPDGPNSVYQALGRAAGATNRNATADQPSDGAGEVAAGLGVAAGQASANENEAIPLSMSPAELAAWAGTPPRLVRALNSTPVPDATTLPLYAEFKQAKGGNDLDFASPGALEVRYLIRHVYDRLSMPFVDIQGRALTGSPWFGPDGGATAGEQPSTDEHWARRAAEALSLLPYMLPSVIYTGPNAPSFIDEDMLYKLQGASPTDDHAYPLALECQQSCTFAALTRGFDIPLKRVKVYGQDELQDPEGSDHIRRPRLATMFTAGPSEGTIKVMTPADQVKWLSRSTGTTNLAKVDAEFAPGSAFAFSDAALAPPGTPYKQTANEHPHIAFAIRTRRDDKGRLRLVQFFDVGGMNVPETPHPAIESAKDREKAYAYEYPWSADGKVGARGAYGGTAQLAPTNETAWRGLARLQDARPLGLARLVLARRHNVAQNRPVNLATDPPAEWLLYASPLMPMYEDSPDPFAVPPNYAVTRYAWSLRGLPGAEHIQPIWQISVPRSVLADTMAFARGTAGSRVPTTRATRFVDLIADVAARKPDWGFKVDGTSKLLVNRDFFGLIDLSIKPDGQVIVHDTARSDFATAAVTRLQRDTVDQGQAGSYALGHFPWGKATVAAGIDLATFTDLPSYFDPLAASAPPAPPEPEPESP